MDSFISMTVEKYDDKGKVILGGENVLFYIRNYFLVDSLNIIMLFVSVVGDADFNLLLLLVSLVRLSCSWRKWKTLDFFLIGCRGREGNFGFVKVILVNLAFAHFLSISLNIMAVNFPERWWPQLEIASNEGYINYIHGL